MLKFCLHCTQVCSTKCTCTRQSCLELNLSSTSCILKNRFNTIVVDTFAKHYSTRHLNLELYFSDHKSGTLATLDRNLFEHYNVHNDTSYCRTTRNMKSKMGETGKVLSIRTRLTVHLQWQSLVQPAGRHWLHIIVCLLRKFIFHRTVRSKRC